MLADTYLWFETENPVMSGLNYRQAVQHIPSAGLQEIAKPFSLNTELVLQWP